MRDITDKVAWITGAGAGIGEGGAAALAEAGVKVVLSGRRQDKLEEVTRRCGPNASIEVLDVSDKEAVFEVAERIVRDHGKIDILVASAGINMKERNWHNVSLEDWDSVIRIDLDGAFYCCKAVLPSMKEVEKAVNSMLRPQVILDLLQNFTSYATHKGKDKRSPNCRKL